MGRRSKNRARTHVIVVQDQSGSMSYRREATLSGYNEYIDGLRDEDGDLRISLTQFHTVVNRVFTGTPIQDVKRMRHGDYRIGGGTALYDAIGDSITSSHHAIGANDKVLVVVMTDGKENSSNHWTRETVTNLMGDKRNSGWEFIFLGAGEEAWSAGNSLGFDSDHSIYYGTMDAHDHTASYGVLRGVTSSVMAGNSAASFLSTSSVKLGLEEKAKDEHTHSVNLSYTQSAEDLAGLTNDPNVTNKS